MNKPTVEILKNIQFDRFGKLPATIKSIRDNSGDIQSGDLFFAIRGIQTDGHKYIKDAVEKGAAAIVAEKFSDSVNVPQIIVENSRSALSAAAANYYEQPSKKLIITGVTGTNGKTTTVYLLNHIFRAANLPRGTVGTLGYSINDTFKTLNLTTPDSIQIQQILTNMVKKNIKYVAMEVSSHALSLNRVDNIEFIGGVFTNISQDHLDFYGDIQSYVAAKTRLFDKISNVGFQLSNADDPYHPMFTKSGSAALFQYSLSAGTDFFWKKGVHYQNGISGIISAKGINIPIQSKLSGKFNLYNILAAVSTAVCLEIDPSAITIALKNIDYIPGRIQEVSQAGFPRTFIDYAHTPDAIRNVLGALRDIVPANGKLVTLFGCGGNRDRAKRPLMAEAVAELSDIAIITTDNPRFEEPETIIDDAIPGFKDGQEYIRIVDRKAAIEYAVSNRKPDDIIAILGKGHEEYQEINGKKYPFSDFQIVNNLMNHD